MQGNKWDFFIAHAGPDKAPAETLYSLLVPRSRVFLDTKCISLGDDWDTVIAHAQRASAVSLILVSDRTDAAYYQREEIAAAIALARQNAEAHRVVPIFLSAEENLRVPTPYGLQLKHGIRLGASSLEDAATRLFDLLASIQHQEASAFLYANYVSQLTSPHLTDHDRQSLVEAVRALPGLPESWRASITGFVNLNNIFDLVDRIAPDPGSKGRRALLLGLHLRSFENALRRRDLSLMSTCAEQFLVALNDMQPPKKLGGEVQTIVNGSLSVDTCTSVEEDLVPRIFQWLKARGRGIIG